MFSRKSIRPFQLTIDYDLFFGKLIDGQTYSRLVLASKMINRQLVVPFTMFSVNDDPIKCLGRGRGEQR